MIPVTKLGFSIVLTIFLAWKIYKSHLRYSDADQTATLETLPTKDTTFIALTICPAFDVAYKSETLESMGSNRSLIQSGRYFSLNESMKNWDFFDQIVYSKEELIRRVIVNTRDRQNAAISLGLENSENATWSNKYNRFYGRCFSLELSKTVTAKGVRSVEIETFIDMYVFLHYPGQFTEYNSMTKASHVVLF